MFSKDKETSFYDYWYILKHAFAIIRSDHKIKNKQLSTIMYFKTMLMLVFRKDTVKWKYF